MLSVAGIAFAQSPVLVKGQPTTVSPPAPANLYVQMVMGEYSSLRLIWTDQSTDETGFEIERKTGAGGTYAQIGTAAANATTYKDTGLLEATQYFYRIRAVNDAGNSVYSNEVDEMTSTPITVVAVCSAALDVQSRRKENRKTNLHWGGCWPCFHLGSF